MARKKRDFDYMELYNPDYRAMKANMFDGINGSSVLDLQGQNGINTDWTFGQQQNNITAPSVQNSAWNMTIQQEGTPAGSYVDPLQTEYHRVNPIKYLTMSEAERMRQNQLRQEARQERRENKQELTQQDSNQSNLGASLTNAIPAAANAMIAAFQNKNANTATRVATALGTPELGKIWSADWDEGNKQLDFVKNKINDATNRYIQDSNDTQGAFSAIKNNNQLNLIDASPSKQLTWRDFRGNLFKKGAIATLQGAAAGSIGGPWGALGGATVGTLGALFGGIGAKKRAKRAYNEYMDKMNYLQTYARGHNTLQRLNQQQSNENLLNNGLKQQRIQDLANINAYGGNLFAVGGETPPPYYPESQDPTAIQWLSDWYRQRPEQVKNTYAPKRANRIQFSLPSSNYTEEYEGIESVPDDRNVVWNTKKYTNVDDYNSDLYKNLIDRTATASPVYRFDDMPHDVNGEYSPLGNYLWQDPEYYSNIKISEEVINFIDDFKKNNNGASPELEDYEKAGIDPKSTLDWTSSQEYRDNPKMAHTVSYNMKQVPALANPDEPYYDEETMPLRLHELTHAGDIGPEILAYPSSPNSPKYSEGEFLTDLPGFINRRKFLREDEFDNPYLDNPTEVHARMNSFRYKSGLQPTQEVDSDFLNNNRELLKEYNLDRYTDDSLIKLFNEVADNSTNNYNNIAAMGGQFDTFNLSPNMIDMQNQSLDNQKYKYMNQMQPIGFVDSGPGKTPNPGMPRLACGGKLHLNKFDFGGSMNGMDIPTGMQSYENGGTHEENPNGGIQVGVDSQGTPNLVEEGEFRWGDYVFSNRIDVDLDVLSDFNVPATKKQGKKANKGKLSYADLAKKMAKKAGDLNDPITKDTLNENMKRASQAQDFQKAQINSDNQLADYKNALKNQTQGNPMYGSMKYNGMGNVNHGLNEGSSAMEGVDNSSLSNVNRSGNAMMAAYGGNLYPYGGYTDEYGNPKSLYTDDELADYLNLGIPGANSITSFDLELQKRNASLPLTYNSNVSPKYIYGDIIKPTLDNNGNLVLVNSWTGEPISGNYQQNQSINNLEKQQDVTIPETSNKPMVDANGNVVTINPETGITSNGYSVDPNYIDVNSNSWTNLAKGSTTFTPLVDNNFGRLYTGFGNSQSDLGGGNIYNQQFGLGIRPDYVESKNPNQKVEAVSTYGKNVNGQIQYDPNGKPVMLYPNTFTGLNGEAANVDNKGFYKFGNTQNTGTSTNSSSYSSASYKHSTQTPQKTGLEDYTPPLTPAESTQEGLPNSKDQAGIVDNRNLDKKHAQFATATTPKVPTLNTAGLYAQLGKGLTKNIYNWAGLANTEFKPNYKPEQDLRALGKTGYVPRTADHSGMYRAADLYDINLANNAAQAQAAATARAMSNVNDRNQRAANQLAADYNAMLGIGNNYQTMFDANMKSRLATDEYNKQTEQTNVAANNDMYRDNQQAGIQAKNFELSANTAANQMQWAKDQYADTQNRIAALNKQSDAARMADNQINFLVDKAKENAYYNLKNKDPRQMYWNDPSTGEWYFKGDNGYYDNLRNAMSGKINSLDTTSNEELAAIADQKGWNNITEEDMKDIIDRQAEREKKISNDKKAKDAQDLRNAQIQYKQMLANIRAVNPDYNPGFKDSDFTTADDWLTGYNGLNTYWLSAINPYLANRKVDNESAYGGKIKTNKRNKNHSYDYMAI